MRLPEPARSIAAAAVDAVAAARSRDSEAYRPAVARLAGLNPAQTGLVLGAVVRSLLEDLHPDGLTGDDVQAALEHCVRSAADWFPEVDPGVLATLLIGALGVHEPDDGSPAPGPAEVARHAPLLVADLLTRSGRDLAGYLDAAFTEIARGETYDVL
ncbi:hypothetical protein ACNTMW_14770 [Planosporangium sp. 12N6]|uniref:hypothetical protein n=1 Tax=Planosporangium spinosum TaxID=3402278 RepID=UPI003CEF0E21